MTALTPVLADMLHSAMPVIDKIYGPEQKGMTTPDDNRELVARMLAPVLSELAGIPSVRALFEMMGEGLVRYADELARQTGKLMTDAPSSSPTPEATPAPEAGRE